MTTYEAALELMNRWAPVEMVRLLEDLGTALRQGLEIEVYKHIPWERFIELT